MKGIFTIERRKATLVDGEWIAGDVIETTEMVNNFNDLKMWQYLNNASYDTYRYTYNYSYSNLWLSTKPYSAPHFRFQDVYNENFIINRSAIVENDKFVPATETDDGYYQFKNRFNPPSADRTIRSIGFRSHSVVTLGTPYVQSTTDILDVTYRIIVRDPDYSMLSGLVPYAAETIGLEYAYPGGSGLVSGENAHNYPRHTMLAPWPANELPHLPYTFEFQGTSSSVVYNYLHMEDGVVEGTGGYTNINTNNGKLLGSIYLGDSQRIATYPTPVKPDNVSCVQNVFGKTAYSTSPYLDIDNQATGTGTVTIDDQDGWTKSDGPCMRYRVNIQTDGATGASTYTVSSCPWPGSEENTFRNRRYMIVPGAPRYSGGVVRGIDDEYHEYHGGSFWNRRNGYTDIQAKNCHFQEYVYPEFIMANSWGITIGHVTKAWENVDVYSSIPLPVTDIQQIAHDTDGNIFVACAETGLWKITRTLEGSITDISRLTASGAADDTHCYGVQIKKLDGSVWAVFGAELCKSTDSGVNWIVYNSGTSPQFLITGITDTVGEERRIQNLVIDHNVSDNRFAIAVASTNEGDDTGTFYWWSDTGSVTTSDELAAGGTSTITRKLYGSVHGKFAASGEFVIASTYWRNYIYYDTNTRIFDWYSPTQKAYAEGVYNSNYTVGAGGPIIYADKTGQEWLLGHRGTTGEYLYRYPLGPFDGTAYEPATKFAPGISYPSENPVAHIGNGILLIDDGGYLCVHHIHCDEISDDHGVSNNFWNEYGWDGANWVLGHSGARTTHATRESIIDGLSVTFSGAAADSFVNTEYYEAYLFNGVLKDNATEFSYRVTMQRNTVKTTASIATGTVPAANLGVTTEPGCVLSWRYYSGSGSSSDHTTAVERTYADTNTSWPRLFHNPGTIQLACTGSDSYPGIIGEQELIGNFTVNFKVNNIVSGSAGGERVQFGVRTYDTSARVSRVPDADIQEFMDFEANKNAEYGILNVRIRDRVSFSTLITVNFTDYDPLSDVFTIERTGTTVTYARNGVVFYTSATSSTANLQFYAASDYYDLYSASFEDITVSYESNRKIVAIGDGVGEGAADPDFRKIVTSPLIRDQYNSVTLDGVPAPINYDGVAPAAGEVTLLPYSGRLWFNDADAGKTIVGNFGYVQKINLQDPGPTGLAQNRFDITVQNDGVNDVFYIDGVAQANIDVVAGETYYFDQSNVTNTGHQFDISLTPDGTNTTGGDNYRNGVGIAGTEGNAGAYTVLHVPTEGIVNLYYFSQQNPGYGGNINIS